MEDRSPIDTVIDPAPAQVRELADACVQYVRKATGISLDYTPDTLPLLDHYLQLSAQTKDDITTLVASAAGAYFGELVRRQYPSRWHAPVDDYGSWRIEFERVFLHFNPVAFAYESMHRKEVVEGGAGFGLLDQDMDAVREGLEVLGTLNEDDYFLLVTRYEVLATIVDRLIARIVTDEESVRVRFDAAAYRVALNEDGDNVLS